MARSFALPEVLANRPPPWRSSSGNGRALHRAVFTFVAVQPPSAASPPDASWRCWARSASASALPCRHAQQPRRRHHAGACSGLSISAIAIETANVGGSVCEINLFSNEIDGDDNARIIIPNGKLWGEIVRVPTRNDTARIELSFQRPANDDIGAAIGA